MTLFHQFGRVFCFVAFHLLFVTQFILEVGNYNALGILDSVLSDSCSRQRRIYTQPYGTISDGKQGYVINSHCEWLIKANSTKQFITLKFLEMVTECSYDHIFVYDGDSYNDTLLGSFSGSTMPPAITATSGYMLILLFSDTNYFADGFVAEYSVTNCPNNCSSHGLCVKHQCQCYVNWSGPACDINLCPELCGENHGRGSCVIADGFQHCKCNANYTGKACDLPILSYEASDEAKWYEVAAERTGLSSRAGHAGVYLAHTDRFYVFGGYNLNYPFGDLIAYDFGLNKWLNLSESSAGLISPPARYGHAMADYFGNIVIFGGTGHSKLLNDIWLYNSAKNVWTREASSSKIRPPPLSKHTLTVVDDEWLFVMGGHMSEGRFSPDLYKINLNDGAQWIKVKVMGGKVLNRRLVGHTTIFHKDMRSLIVYGGISADSARFSKLSREMHAFHVDENYWTLIHSFAGSNIKNSAKHWIPMERAFHSANVIGDYMIVYGGYSHRHNMLEICYDDELYFYHLGCHKWIDHSIFKEESIKKAFLPRGSFSHASAVKNGNMLLISGGYSGNVRGDLNAYLVSEAIYPSSAKKQSSCSSFSKRDICKSISGCGWCHATSVCFNSSTEYEKCTSKLDVAECPGLCSTFEDCQSCLMFGRRYQNSSSGIASASKLCSWCVQTGKCLLHEEDKQCWSNDKGIIGWWGNETTEITKFSQCKLQDFRPGLTWLRYRYPMNASHPDGVSIISKTAQIFAFKPVLVREVEAGGEFTSRFLGFIHPLGAKPKVESALIVLMGSSESSAVLKMSINSDPKYAEHVANHTASAHYKRTLAQRSDNKIPIFPNSSIGHKYFIDFVAKQKIVQSLRTEVNASMQLEWNGYRLYRDVFTWEFLEPFHTDDCESNTNCLQCLSNSYCGWHEQLKICIHRVNDSIEDFHSQSSIDLPYLNLDPSQCNVCPDYIYCEDCVQALNCEWMVEKAICVRGGRFNDAVRSIRGCPVACHKRQSCFDCLGLPGRCAWCEQTQSCFLFSTFTTYFQYGACREWVDEDHAVLNRYENGSLAINARCKHCGLHKTCKSCLEDLSCGWCGNRRNPTYGVCIKGDFKHPYDGNCASLVGQAHNISDAEPADWSYSMCPDIDECKLGLHNCHSNATCVNTFESYSCECKRGFEGDGIKSCERMCYEDCVHGFCSDAPDYRCICELGWTGIACDTDCGCHNHSTCESRVGSCDKCQEWTEGESCELCKVGSYGDATLEFGCHPCNCNDHGNTSAGICNSSTGVCYCEHQTMGPKCEECKPGFYGNPRNGGQCYRKCEPRAVVTNLESGGLGSSGANKDHEFCLWILSVFDEFDTNNLMMKRKTRSIKSSDRIRLTIHNDISIPCDQNSVYVYDGFPGFMISNAFPQWSSGKLLGRFCKSSASSQNMTIEATSGFMTVYFSKSFNQDSFNSTYGFNSTFNVIKCKDGCVGPGKHECRDGNCVCPKSYYGIDCKSRICQNNCNASKDKMGRRLSYCDKELGRCVCQRGYGGDDCSIKLNYGNVIWNTIYNPNTIEEDLINPAKSISRMGHSLHALNDSHLLIFGGYSLTKGVMNDLYLMNIKRNRWTKIFENGNTPSARYLHSSVYIESTNRLYVYGGMNDDQIFNDFWMFNVDDSSWTQLETGSNILPLAGHSLTHVSNKRLLLIGGFSPEYGFSEDMHVYDLEKYKWYLQPVSGAIPIGIYGHSAVYHSITNSIYVFGGYLYKVDKTFISNELYAFQLDTNRWTRLPLYIRKDVDVEEEKPSARYFHVALATDEYMIVIGGASAERRDTASLYNFKCNRWISLNQPGLEVIGKPVGSIFGLALTRHNNSLYIYGGFDGVIQENLISLTLPSDSCGIYSHSRTSCLKYVGCSYCSVFQKDGTNLTFCYNNDKDPPKQCYDPSGASERSEGFSCNTQWLNSRNCYQFSSCSECLAEWPAHKNASHVCQWCTNCQVGKCIPSGGVCEEENNCNLQQRVTKNATQCPERLCPASDCEKCSKKQKCMWTRHVLRSSELGRTLNQMPIYNWTCVRKIIQDASNFPIVAMPPRSCPIKCHHLKSCGACLQSNGGEGGWHFCSWSEKLNKCMAPSFQPLRCSFGECGSIIRQHKESKKESMQCFPPCHEYSQSRTCLSRPNCGWCAFSGKLVDGRGVCLQGELFGPIKGSCSSSGIKIDDDTPLSVNVTKWISMADGSPLWSYLRRPPENECLNGHHNCDEEREECIDTEESFKCKCRPGYLPFKDGTCEPVCNQGCAFGKCVQPDVCQCLFGYVGHNCSTQCHCNGQSNCAGPNQLDKCLECHNNTQGPQCEKCKPFFVGNPRKNIKCISCKVFCNGHSEVCLSPELLNFSSVMLSSIHLQPQLTLNNFYMSYLDSIVTEGPESEAICLFCKHNTEGDRCEQCDPGFFRTGDSTHNGCRPCECHGHSNLCDPSNGENCKCRNNTETDPQCNPKTSKNILQPCWKLQCSKCKEYFLGTPTNGHQCYRHMFVEKDYCFDPYTQDECSRIPSPLMQGRTVFFAVQPKYMNVDIRIVVDISEGGVDFFFSAKEDTYVVDVNKTSGVHFVSIDERYGLELDEFYEHPGISIQDVESTFVVKRSVKQDLDDGSSVNLTERFQQHKLKEITASPEELNKFVRINDPHEFLVIRNLRNRLVITVPLEVHDLRSTRFYMVLRGIGNEASNFTYGSMFFRQDQPRIDLFVFFSVFFSCFFLFLAICVVMWKVKQMLDHRQAQQRHAEEMKHMASRPFAKVLVIIDDPDRDDFDFMVPPSMYSSPSHPSHNHHHKKGRNKHLVYTQNIRDPSPKMPLLPVEDKFGVHAISIEPTCDNLAAVTTLLMQLPGGSCAPVRLALSSALVNVRSIPQSHGGGNGLRTYIRRRTSHINV